jgi:hypothetical protein
LCRFEDAVGGMGAWKQRPDAKNGQRRDERYEE